MADIFLSYSRTDQAAAANLAQLLERAGHSVWWDRYIKGGAAYAKDIERELQSARAVVVAWSETSIGSDWVKDEAAFGRDRHILVPVSLDGVDQPLGFRQYQTIDFKGWKGDPAARPARLLLEAVAERLHAPPPGPPPRESVVRRLRRRPAMVGAIAAAIAAAGALFAFRDDIAGAVGGKRAGAIPEVSVAVLPFADMSTARDQGPIADGVAEQILNALAGMDGLSVISRTSAFVFRNEIVPISEIARRLGVRYVLEGSWFTARDGVRVQARLIDAASDRPIWADEYRRTIADPEDLAGIQEDIANAVAGALRAEFGLPEPEKISIKVSTSNLSAYDLHLRARSLYLSRRPENIEKAIDYLEQAVALDPNFAQGWEQLGAVYAVARSYGLSGMDFAALAAEANARALKLDNSLSMPYAVTGLALRAQYPTPWAQSIDNLKKAVERDSRNADALLWLGMNYVALGYMEKAVEALSACLKIDPAYSNCRKNRAVAQMVLGRADEAMNDAETNIKAGFLRDADVYIPLFLARGDRDAALLISGQINSWEGFPHEDFIAAIGEPDRVNPSKYAELKAWGEANDVDVASKSHVALAFRAYDEMTVANFGNAYENLWLPAFSGFRRSEPFKALMRDLGHVGYWRANGYPPQCRALSGADFECA
jgi:TolB-like protein